MKNVISSVSNNRNIMSRALHDTAAAASVVMGKRYIFLLCETIDETARAK